MMQIVIRLCPYRMGKKLAIKEKYICLCDYQSTKHLHFLFYNYLFFLRHTSWSHETGITSKELSFFFKYYQIILSYSKQSFTIVYFLHK